MKHVTDKHNHRVGDDLQAFTAQAITSSPKLPFAGLTKAEIENAYAVAQKSPDASDSKVIIEYVKRGMK